jgi:hypothetical protein
MKKIAILALAVFMLFSAASCNAPSKAEAFSEEKFYQRAWVRRLPQ